MHLPSATRVLVVVVAVAQAEIAIVLAVVAAVTTSILIAIGATAHQVMSPIPILVSIKCPLRPRTPSLTVPPLPLPSV